MKQYILIDGHSIIYRSYYAFIRNPLRNSKGFNTSAIYGFINTLKKIEKKFETEYLAVTFDAGKKTFRHDQYESYKATRKPPPDDLPPQIPIIKQLVTAMGIKCFELVGYEADDLLATLSNILSQYGKVYIVTFDKDLLQLVGGNIFVFDPYRDLIYDSQVVVEKFGVDPSHIVDLLSIAGDASDNVPGVPGFGLKRARALIERFGNIDRATKADPKLKEFEDDIKFFRSLLTVDKNVPIGIENDEIRVDKMDEKKLVAIFREMEFYQLMGDFLNHEEQGDFKPGGGSIKESRYGIFVDDQIYLSDRERKARSYPILAENISVLKNSELISFSIKDVIRKLNKVPESYLDVGIGAQLIAPGRKLSYENLVLEYFGHVVESFSQYQIADYALRLAPIIREKIIESKLERVFDLEQRLVPVIAAMEKRGIGIDRDRVIDLKNEIDKERSSLELEIYRIAGRSFNINSPKQLANILFDVLGLEPIKRKKTGYSTDSTVLLELSKRHPLPEKILVFREKSKLISTYLDPILEKIDKDKNRIHTTFNQLGAATGRLSSSNPNLQNIPPALKEIFVAQRGYKFISADYSQIELRILAHLSGDHNLIDSFQGGIDIHSLTARELFNISRDALQGDHRRIAKMVNYGIIYGLSEFGLAQGLNITREEARLIIERHQKLYPDAQHWIAKHIETVAKTGETRTIIGRKREFGQPLTGAKIRAAINSPIQGSAADIIKMAMVEIEEKLSERDIDKGVLVQVHDELLLEVKEEKIEEAVEIVREEMENVFRLKVPISVNIGVGGDWHEAH